MHPEYRSRLAAQEIKRDARTDVFAVAPPLEALKLLFSMAVTEGIGYQRGDREGGMKMAFIDIRRAFFHADARRAVLVELAPEDAEPGVCGQLLKSMYGTRDAAQHWEFQYAMFMTDIGLIRGASSQRAFHHPHRELRVVAHGDDFTILGWLNQVDWFEARIAETLER